MTGLARWIGCWWRRITGNIPALCVIGTILALLGIALGFAFAGSPPQGGQNVNPGPVHTAPVHPGTPAPSSPSQGGSGAPVAPTPKPAPNPAPTPPPMHHKQPCGVGMTITVHKGDTLWSLSGSTPAHGLKWEHLARVNHIRTPYIIHVGQVLRA